MRWKIIQISDILNKERWMLIWEEIREKSTISKLQNFSFLHPISSNHQFLTLSARSTSAPCSIKIWDISGWLSLAKDKGVDPSCLKNHQLEKRSWNSSYTILSIHFCSFPQQKQNSLQLFISPIWRIKNHIMKRSTFILKYQNIIQSIDHQTFWWEEVLELMLDELIFFFNSSNNPFLQVFSKSTLILDSSIVYLISFPN